MYIFVTDTSTPVSVGSSLCDDGLVDPDSDSEVTVLGTLHVI